jgi:two-component system, sensor histidine kinase LadS
MIRKIALYGLALLITFLLPSKSVGQDLIEFNSTGANLNQSISDQFTLYETDKETSINEFIANKSDFKGVRIKRSLANLDFTDSYFFLSFELKNSLNEKLNLVLETARPITNDVQLFDVESLETFHSGDAIPFKSKDLEINISAFKLVLLPNQKKEFVLKLHSDGESLVIPMIFREQSQFDEVQRQNQLVFGLFIGIFLFTIIIYSAFYALLRDRLFLVYVIYVFFSGLLQFALDGYLHQYIFTSGNYLTQHSIILIAGLAVLFALSYATSYLKLEGIFRRISRAFIVLVTITMIASTIPGSPYLIAFPLINLLSFGALVFILIAGLRMYSNGKVSIFFIIGLGSIVAGGIVFLLGNFGVIDALWFTQPALKVGAMIEIICLSILMAGQYKQLQQEKELAQKALLTQLEETNLKLETIVEERTRELNSQRLLLKQRNDDFVSSVRYAEKIQSAVMSNESKLKSILPDSFVFFRPKDIVSGDFYWVEQLAPNKNWKNGLVLWATADCTGHGVPGAFVSIIGNYLLQMTKNNSEIKYPGQVLDFLNTQINRTLNSEFNREIIRDGMDMVLCALDREDKKLYFSGAKNPIYIVRKNELLEFKGDRKPIGFDDSAEEFHFATQTIDLEDGDMIYSFSDGFADQFGGPKGKKFMTKKLKQMLTDQASHEVSNQQAHIESTFDSWCGDLDQLDDVLLIGIRF